MLGKISKLATALATGAMVSLAATAGVNGATAAVAPTSSAAAVVSKMTGPGSVSDTPARWGVYATDLGIMWDNGAGEVLTAFGDTFGEQWAPPGGNGNDWRSQVLLRSADTVLEDGMTFSSASEDWPGHAQELIPSLKIDNTEMTVIPTAGISVGTRQYLGYMSVRHWGEPGSWDTNYAAIAYSDDNGDTWITEGGPRWDNPDGSNRFQMASFVRRDGFVYMFATPNGRNDAAYLARVSEGEILSKTAWRYWTGVEWSESQENAVPVVEGPVAELSVQWNEYANRWLMVYMRDSEIVLRSALSPTSAWSDPEVLVSADDYPGPYGGFLHPWSSGSELYFALSQWNPYNVYLMRVGIQVDGSVGSSNLLKDPSFERQESGQLGGAWSCGGNCGVDDQMWGFTGDKNAFVRFNAGWHDISQVVTVEPNQDYELTAWLRTSENNDNGFVGVRNVGGAPIAERNFRAVGEWARFSVSFNSGSMNQIEVFAGIWTDNGDMWLQVDDVALVAQ